MKHKRLNKKVSDHHVSDVRCLKVRCQCDDALKDLLPLPPDSVIAKHDSDEVDSVLVDGFIDFSRFDRGSDGSAARGNSESELIRLGSQACAMVTRVVSATSAEAMSDPRASDAMAADVQKQIKRNTFDDFAKVEEWSTIREKFPSARVVRGHMLLGIKHEEDPSAAHWKGRLVAAGNAVRDVQGGLVADAMFSEPPISLDAVRMVLTHALTVDDGVALAADVEAAFLQAPLEG